MSEQGAGHEPNKAEQKVGDTLHAAAGKEVNKVVDAARRDIDEEGEEERRDIVIHAGYELFVAGFLVVQLVNSTLFFLPLESEQRHIVREFWIGISIFLFLDALVRLRRAPSKHRHMFTYYGWLTWVGSMPIPFVTGVRLFGTSIALRKLRRGEFKEIGRVVVSRHAQSTLLLVIFLAVLFFEYGSLLVLTAEQNAPDANITTSQDAIWWSLVTISTVGYGDTFPTTYPGRLIGAVLIVSGVGLFTSITSFMARWFMRPRTPKREQVHTRMPQAPQVQIGEIRSLLEELDDSHRQKVQELEDRLSQLESSVATSDRGRQSVR